MSLPTFPEGAEVDNTATTPDGHLGWWNMMAGYRMHTIPACDLKCHVLSDECWCRPEDDGMTIIHVAADGRERYQEGSAQMH